VSYAEIYNEVINDLLELSNTNLKIHEDLQRGVFVGNLKEEVTCTPEQMLYLMELGEQSRHTGETKMNERSSRSHAIFRIIIESREKVAPRTSNGNSDPDDAALLLEESSEPVRVSVLNLVDLAGSERVAHTLAEGERLKEGCHINKSLLTLGTVIGKLSEGSKHIPYRDSKLTRILQPALGGNSRTAIICTVTPAAVHSDETLSTLKFANRAKNICNKAHINEILNDQVLMKKFKKETDEWKERCSELEQTISQLTSSNTELKQQLEDSMQSAAKLELIVQQQQEMQRQQDPNLLAKLEDALTKLASFEQENMLLQSALRAEQSKALLEQQLLQTKLFEMEQKMAQQTSELQINFDTKISAANEQLSQLQAELDGEKKLHQDELQELEEYIRQLEDERYDKLYASESNVELIAGLNSQVNKLQSEIDHLRVASMSPAAFNNKTKENVNPTADKNPQQGKTPTPVNDTKQQALSKIEQLKLRRQTAVFRPSTRHNNL